MKSFHVILSVIFMYTVKSQVVQNCDQVLQFYSQLGYLISDCYQASANKLYFRLDQRMTNKVARAACDEAENADLAVVNGFSDQRILNALFTAKIIMNTWMWIGIERQNGKLLWINGGIVPSLRWYPSANNESISNGDCAVMIMLADETGDKDGAGTFYYTERCDREYIAACQAIIF